MTISVSVTVTVTVTVSVSAFEAVSVQAISAGERACPRVCICVSWPSLRCQYLHALRRVSRVCIWCSAQQDLKPSKYADTLVQLDNGVKIPRKGWKCAKVFSKHSLSFSFY
jgi:hypothetical protein